MEIGGVFEIFIFAKFVFVLPRKIHSSPIKLDIIGIPTPIEDDMKRYGIYQILLILIAI